MLGFNKYMLDMRVMVSTATATNDNLFWYVENTVHSKITMTRNKVPY